MATAASPSPSSSSIAGRVHRLGLPLFVAGLISAYFTVAGLLGHPGDVIARFIGILWLAYIALCGVGLLVNRRGRSALAAWLILSGPLVIVPITSIAVAGMGVIAGLGVTVMVTLIATLIDLPRPQLRAAVGAALGIGLITLFGDAFGIGGRATLPAPAQILALIAVGVLSLVLALLVLRRFDTYSLRTKVTLGFLFVTLVPLVVLAYLNDRTARASLTEAAKRSLHAAAEQTATSIDSFIASGLDTVTAEAKLSLLGDYLDFVATQPLDSPTLVTDPLVLQTQSLLITLRNKELHNVPSAQRFQYRPEYFVVDRDGRVVLTSFRPLNGADYSQRTFFTEPFTSGRAFVSEVEFASGPVEPSPAALYFAARIVNSRGVRVGVLVARYDAATLQALIQASNGLVGSTSSAALFDQNLLRLADGNHPDLNYSLLETPPVDVADQMRAALRLPARTVSLNQMAAVQALRLSETQPYFTGATHPEDSLELASIVPMTTREWKLVFEQDQAEFLQPAEAQSRNTLILALVIAAFVAALAFGVSQVLTAPITILTQVSAAVSAGDLNARAEVKTHDEIGTLANAFNSMTTRLQDLIGSLEQRVNERTAQLQAAADIGRASTQVRNVDELLRQALNLIRERFPTIYQASVFLIDESGRNAVLKESTGEVGAVLKSSGYQLEVGSHSLIGWVTANRQPRVAADVGADPYYLKNPLLPHTQSEAAVPLIVGATLLGVLDVQSREVNTFSPALLQVLQTVADQLSVAIENAQLFQRTQASLAEVSSLYQRVVGGGWSQMVQAQARELVFNLKPAEIADEAGGEEVIRLPIRLRGQVMGMMEIHGRSETGLAEDERAVLETAAAQLSVALEGAVLFEESQRRSHREQIINQIADQMRATLNQSAVAQSGIRELGRALGASEVVVKLTAAGARRPGADQGPKA